MYLFAFFYSLLVLVLFIFFRILVLFRFFSSLLSLLLELKIILSTAKRPFRSDGVREFFRQYQQIGYQETVTTEVFHPITQDELGK